MKDNINYHTSMTNFWLLGIWKDQLATPEVATLLKRRRCLPGEVTTKQVMNKTTACCRNVHVSAQFYWISLKNLYNMLLYRSWWIFSIRTLESYLFLLANQSIYIQIYAISHTLIHTLCLSKYAILPIKLSSDARSLQNLSPWNSKSIWIMPSVVTCAVITLCEH